MGIIPEGTRAFMARPEFRQKAKEIDRLSSLEERLSRLEGKQDSDSRRILHIEKSYVPTSEFLKFRDDINIIKKHVVQNDPGTPKPPTQQRSSSRMIRSATAIAAQREERLGVSSQKVAKESKMPVRTPMIRRRTSAIPSLDIVLQLPRRCLSHTGTSIAKKDNHSFACLLNQKIKNMSWNNEQLVEYWGNISDKRRRSDILWGYLDRTLSSDTYGKKENDRRAVTEEWAIRAGRLFGVNVIFE